MSSRGMEMGNRSVTRWGGGRAQPPGPSLILFKKSKRTVMIDMILNHFNIEIIYIIINFIKI